jgi:predicted nucleic acid-binding protein
VLTLDAAVDSRLELIISPQLPQEIATVLARPRLWKHLSSAEAPGSSPTLPARMMTLMADPSARQAAVSRDPDDYQLLALATPTAPTRTVTGDLATPIGHDPSRDRLPDA